MTPEIVNILTVFVSVVRKNRRRSNPGDIRGYAWQGLGEATHALPKTSHAIVGLVMMYLVPIVRTTMICKSPMCF